MTTMEFYLKDIWVKTIDLLVQSQQLSRETINIINQSELISLDKEKGALILGPLFLHCAILQQNKTLIETCLEEILDQEISINILEKSKYEELNRESSSYTNDFINRTVNADFNFGNFVIGRSNAQAQVAALTCATNLGLLYNPLFIYGNSGLGKTHLLNAIGNFVLNNNKGKNIGFVSGMDFVDGVRKASEENRLNEFKEGFNDLDLLLVDDIQFIGEGNKVKTHEIFFSVFKNLIDNKKQVVLCSDRAPADIIGLEDRIISRFNQGLTVNIEALEYETSMNILKMKVSNLFPSLQNFDEEVLSYIATNFSQDVRSLEGAITRLLFYSSFVNKENIDMDLAIEAFKEQITVNTNELNISKIRKIVCEYYNLTKQQIISKTRTKNIATARHIAIYLCRKLLDAPYKDIGNEFGKRDHSTVMSSCEKVEELIKTDPLFLRAINDIENRIK